MVGTMAELPKHILRLHTVRWKELTEKHGFTGDHLTWHQSRDRRHQAARPRYSLAPPPIRMLNSNEPYSKVTHLGRNGEPVSYEEWRKIEEANWISRESDPIVIDSIGILETVALATARFAEIVGDYLSNWASGTEADSDVFAERLQSVRLSVLNEIRSLWKES